MRSPMSEGELSTKNGTIYVVYHNTHNIISPRKVKVGNSRALSWLSKTIILLVVGWDGYRNWGNGTKNQNVLLQSPYPQSWQGGKEWEGVQYKVDKAHHYYVLLCYWPRSEEEENWDPLLLSYYKEKMLVGFSIPSLCKGHSTRNFKTLS